MRGGQRMQLRGLQKANRQLLLASELTYEDDTSETLANLAHQVGELASSGEPDTDAVVSIGQRLQSLREKTHTETRDAIVRAQELLSPYCSANPQA